MKFDKRKLEEFDIGAEYHQAWHEACEDWDVHEFINWKFMPDNYRGSIPGDVFKFIYACQDFIKNSIIRECCKEDDR